MDIGRIWAIVAKDLLEALRNKTILVAIFLPLAASLSLAVIADPEKPVHLDVGVLGSDNYPLEVYLATSVPELVYVTHYEDLELGQEAVARGDIDVLITKNTAQDANLPADFTAFTDGSSVGIQLAVKEVLEPLLAAYLGRATEPTVDFIFINQSKPGQALIPLWLTITTVMVGVMILSGNFAEEKEKGTLDNIRISPAQDGEILVSKGISGVILIVLVSVIMLGLNKVTLPNIAGYISLALLIVMGAVIFTAIGLLIGIFSKTQSAARAISTIIYFPLIFPALAADFAPGAAKMAAFLPSFYLYRGLKETMLFSPSLFALKADLVGLTVFLLISFSGTMWGYRKVLRQER